MINLMPIGGLCNRLRAMESAIRLARECDVGLSVYWMIEADAMPQPFSDLFELPSTGFRLHDMRHYGPYSRVLFSRLNPFRYYANGCNEYVRACKTNVFARMCAAHITWNEFYVRGADRDYSWLKPKRHLQDRVDELYEKIGPNAIGIHIRRTDNKWSIEKSPIGLFKWRISKEIENDSGVRFFLASDDIETKRMLVREFGDVIVTRKDVKGRFERDGTEDAVIDLMLLSRMRSVWGSFGSSFSVVASQIKGIPLEILKLDAAGFINDERTNWAYPQTV